MVSEARTNAAAQSTTSRRRPAATSSSQKLPPQSSSSSSQQPQMVPPPPPALSSSGNPLDDDPAAHHRSSPNGTARSRRKVLRSNSNNNKSESNGTTNSNRRRGGSSGVRASVTVMFVACTLSLLALWFAFLAHVIQHRRDFPSVRFFHGLQWRREHGGSQSTTGAITESNGSNKGDDSNSNSAFCNFRRYPPHRYYQLETLPSDDNNGAPRQQRQQPAFLTTDAEYIFGEWPVLLREHEYPPAKLCVDQSGWLSPPVKQSAGGSNKSQNKNGTMIWPFADGTNPSILTLHRLRQMAPAVAAAIWRHCPSARYVVTVCLTNSQCSWRDDDSEPRNNGLLWDLPDPRQREPDTVRTVLQLLDGRRRVLQEATIYLERDAAWGKKLPAPQQQLRKPPQHLPALDDARLFVHDQQLLVSYREGPGFGYETQVLNPIYLEFTTSDTSITSGSAAIKATIVASETMSFCCGRNMALLNLPTDLSSNLFALTWVDPVTVIPVDTTPLVQQQQQPKKKQPKNKQQRRLLTAKSAVVQQKESDHSSMTTSTQQQHRVLQERQPKKKPHKSHIHGTNAFMVPLPNENNNNNSDNKRYEYLGVAHFHRPNDRKPNPFARFGHHYTHAFYRVELDAHNNAWKLSGLSPEFVLPSAVPAHRDDAEIIQFVSGLELLDQEVILAYGINDCEAALTTIDLAAVRGMLRDVKDGAQVVDFMKPLRQHRAPPSSEKVAA